MPSLRVSCRRDLRVRVEVYASEETIEIFVEADFETLPEERRRFALINVPRQQFSQATGKAARPHARRALGKLCSPPHFRRRHAEVACQCRHGTSKARRPTSTAEEVRAFFCTDQLRNPQHRRRVSVACPRNRPENGAVAIWGG